MEQRTYIKDMEYEQWSELLDRFLKSNLFCTDKVEFAQKFIDGEVEAEKLIKLGNLPNLPKEISEEFNNRGIRAAERYLAMRGYEILDVDNEDNVIVAATEDETTVFAKITTRDLRDGKTFSFSDNGRGQSWLEEYAGKWIGENTKDNEGPIRFDIIAINVIGDERAMVRHHINAFNPIPE